MVGNGIRIALLMIAGCAVALAAPAPLCAEAVDLQAGKTELDPSLLCTEAIAMAERAEAIPRHLLGAIAAAESGRPVAEDRIGGPWPWTVTAAGRGLFFASKDQAMDAAAEALAGGQDNVDIGCLQINLRHHPDAFVGLEEAFDPLANAAYGAVYLRALFMETGSWREAVGRYHSATPARNTWYREKVLAVWNRSRGIPAPVRTRAETSSPRRALVGGRDTSRGSPAPRLDADVLGELKTRLGDLAPRD